MGDPQELGRELLEVLAATIDTLSPEARDEITRIRAGVDGLAVQLREAGWSPGQIGVMVCDVLVNNSQLGHEAAIAVALEMMR